MHHLNSSVTKNNNTPLLANNEECNVIPVLRRATSSDDAQVTTTPALQRPRSFSLLDRTTEHQPLLNLMIPELSDAVEAFFTDEAMILPKLCRASRKFRRLNTLLLEAVKYHDVQEIERLIRMGANPNATCCLNCVSVCHLAAMRSDDALTILLSNGAEKQRSDRLGRTPLHFAAWAGNVKQIAILLGFSTDLQNRLNRGHMSVATEEEVKNLSQNIKELVNVKCDFGQTNGMLPKDWMDSDIDHNCKQFEKGLPMLQTGWSALHAACVCAQSSCARLLIAAGADICARDLVGRTPLDIAGSAYYADQNIDPQNFAETVAMLVNANCKSFTLKNRKTLDTPLHTAVEVNSLDAVSILVGAHVPVNWLNHAGLTPLHMCVKKKLKEHLQILANHGVSDANIPTIVDVTDKDGHTVLHEAILENWGPGVCVAIEAGANITAKDNRGETPIHLAAAKGNVDILSDILNAAKQKDVIDTTNSVRETALFKAVINGHTECVKKLLQEGASIRKTLPRQVNVFHVAAEKGFLDVLQVLLDYDYTITRGMINFLTADDKKGYGPIHFAVQNNHPKCVKILLSRNTYRSLKTSYGLHKGSTPLHIAAINNNVEIAKIIMKNNEDTVHTINDLGWTPLHTASHYGSRDMIILLLKKGADLSSSTNGPHKCKTTAIDMIMNNLSKPTEFMENIFDTYIYTNDSNLQDTNCEITVNYKVLVPKDEENQQMKVVDAFLKTGDRYGQRRLLVHPLLESFLYLKWKALQPFFYAMIAFYASFVMSLTTFIMSTFFYKDTDHDVPAILDTTAWGMILYVSVCLIVSQEVLYMNVSSRYFCQLETWVKFSSICLAAILPHAVTEITQTGTDWPRHIATVALLLSWLEMLFLLSRFPNWGYYVLMFGKVSTNVIKILFTFAFLVIGFSLAFMIQFHSQTPFESPWAALIKTLVMMTSEFDYEGLFKQRDPKYFVTSILVVRLIFFVFLILAAIVLMNLMVGVAVNDLHNLQVLGNVRRLGKQVEFLESLENLVYNQFFRKILPTWLENRIILKNTKRLLNVFVMQPSVPNSECYKALPSHIRDAIFDNAQSQRKLLEDELGSQNYRNKLDEIYEATVKNFNKLENVTNKNVKTDILRTNTNFQDIAKQIQDLDSTITTVRDQTKLSLNKMKTSIEELHIKMDDILNKLESSFVR